jgi:hypothetical protein
VIIASTLLHAFYGITISRARSDDRYDTLNTSHVIQIKLTSFGKHRNIHVPLSIEHSATPRNSSSPLKAYNFARRVCHGRYWRVPYQFG